MKAFVLAAGLGTRLRPWTLEHPKALVPVGGTPMLERVICRLRTFGFDDITVNVHHFASQIVDFLAARDFGCAIHISDESDELLDTGGAIMRAAGFLCADNEPFLVHNVDILSDADLSVLMRAHSECGADSTLLVSDRESSRKLLFDSAMRLRAWRNLQTGEFRPARPEDLGLLKELAFSGIHVMSPAALTDMRRLGYEGKFSVMDFLLDARREADVRGFDGKGLQLIDIGKPATLSRANALF